MSAATPDDPQQQRLEALVAEALERLDEHGEAALAEFLQQHAAEAAEVERVLGHVRSNGLLARPPAQAQAGDLLGDFRLVERIGGGGMGVVFAAEQVSLHRRVAVKVIRSDLLCLDSARARFRREVEAVASLHHPGIVRVISVGETDSIPYFAMEQVAGRGTDAIVDGLAGRDPATLQASAWQPAAAAAPDAANARRSTSSPASETWWRIGVALALQVTEAMAHAHSRGIVHRDLKPSNIMVTPGGTAVVIDFGLAHIEASHRVTLAGTEPGSPAYMSPEQLRGEPSDERTDVYSLAATLHEWLCLQPPFRGDSLAGIREQALRGEFPSIRTRNRAVPRDLETVCEKAMDRDRDRRYPTMQAFGADLAAVLAMRPIAARPASPGLRLARWAQRNRGLAGALTAVLAASLLLPFAFYVQEARASSRVQAQYERAQRYLGTSLDAVDRLLVSLGETGLVEVPGAELVSLRALEEATALHRGLVADQPDSPELRWARANVLTSHARALAKLSRHAEARSLFEEVIDLLGRDDVAVPTQWLQKRAEARRLLVLTLKSTGDSTGVQLHAAQARRELQALRDGAPADQKTRELRARLLWMLAVVEPDPAVEESLLVQARQEYLEILAGAPASPGTAAEVREIEAGIANGLASISHNLSRIYEQTGRSRAWLAESRSAIAGLRRLPPPATELTRRQLGLLLQREGLAMQALGEANAKQPLSEAVTVLEGLRRDFPNMPLHAATLASALHNLAFTIHAEQPAQAVQCMERAVDQHAFVLERDPTLPAEQQHMQNHLALLLPWLVEAGSLAAALPRARQLGELQGPAWRPYAGAYHLALVASRILEQQPQRHVVLLPPLEGPARALLGEQAYGTLGTLLDRGVRYWDARPARAKLQPWLDQAMQFLLEAERRGWPADADLDAPSFVLLRERAEFQDLRTRIGR